MLQYTTEQLATVIAIPIVSILLIWTITIFQKNRKRWGPYDIPIVSLLFLSIFRNITILTYTLIIILNQATFNLDYCSIVIWIFNSIHTFQASCLTTIAVIGLFSVKLHCKQQNLRQFLTSTHVIYHLFCLTTLCACVGVAAILAQNDGNIFKNVAVFDLNPCKFLPFQLDLKFNVFILVLHIFLAIISAIVFVLICVHYYRNKKQRGFDYLKKSSSDLSDLSLGGNLSSSTFGKDNKNYYDTYTIQRHHDGGGCYYDQNGVQHFQKDTVWNSDMSNISATVSSTNSRRPCIAKHIQDTDENRTGLETIHPVLIVCYLFYHLPIIVLCIHPKLIAPWPVVGAALWLGLLQDILLPIGLGIVDSRFTKWVSNVYKCSRTLVEEKLPHVGLDGKFRPFGGSQPQSLDINQTQERSVLRNAGALQAVEHRFPITNGSLYTSIDGRLPVIHNYRRHKEQRGIKTETQSSHVALHSSHLKRNEIPPSCRNCEVDLCPSHSNLHHLSPHYMNKQINFMQQNVNNLLLGRGNRISLSQESLQPQQPQVFYRPEFNNHIMKTSRNLVRLNRMRLSKSEDSLNEVQRNLNEFKKNPQVFENQQTIAEYAISSDDDDYLTDVQIDHNKNFDSLSSRSCYSITTEANCDFEFYQNKNEVNNNNDLEYFLPTSEATFTTFKPNITGGRTSPTDFNKNFKITRSNSKRSLENFQAFIEDDVTNRIQRSNSYMTLEDRKKKSSRTKVDNNARARIKSVEYLPHLDSKLMQDVCYLNVNQPRHVDSKFVVGSVPDFKKVFISEYI